MNEVGVGRLAAGGADGGGDLAAMVGTMHDHVHQDVGLAAAEFFSFAVLVAGLGGEIEAAQESFPLSFELGDFSGALLGRQFRPPLGIGFGNFGAHVQSLPSRAGWQPNPIVSGS